MPQSGKNKKRLSGSARRNAGPGGNKSVIRSEAPKGRKFNFRLLGMLLLSFIVIFGIYRVFIALEIEAVMWVYLAITCILCITYFVVNRGISIDIPTESDLPDEWDDSKKAEFIADRIDRRRKAKFILILLIPFLICFFVDIMELFYIDKIRGLFGGVK